MRNHHLFAVVAPLSLALAACYDADDANYSDNGYDAADANYSGNVDYSADANAAGYGNQAASGSNWPSGSRIVEESGVTYRIDADGTRVRLGDSDARIVVEEGVRYRVDPGGVRVRIDDTGAVLGVDTSVPVSDNVSVTVNQN